MKIALRAGAAALCLSLLSLAAPASAQTPADDGDLKCVIVMFAMASSPSAPDSMKQFAPVGAAYFWGKLKGRSPSVDLQSRAVTLVKGLKDVDLQPETVRCAGELQSLGAETKALGEKLQSAVAATPAAPAPTPIPKR